MPNDVDLYQPGGLQPYVGGDQPLAPSPADNWGDVPVDYLGGNQHQTGQVQLFGQTLPPGATAEHVQQAIGQIAGVFLSDFSILGHDPQHIQASIAWLQQVATQPLRRERKRHRYNLFQLTGDVAMENFANYAHDYGMSAKMVSDIVWWCSELEKRQGEQTHVNHDQAPAQGRATSSTEDWENSLSDSEYNALVEYNDRMKARTADILQAKWKDSYLANIRMVDAYVAGLSAVEKAHLDTYTNTGLHALNDPFIIEQLFLQAIGGGSLPTSGAALQDEIEACHRCMREQPKKWRADERLQSRYRHLLDLQRGR